MTLIYYSQFVKIIKDRKNRLYGFWDGRRQFLSCMNIRRLIKRGFLIGRGPGVKLEWLVPASVNSVGIVNELWRRFVERNETASHKREDSEIDFTSASLTSATQKDTYLRGACFQIIRSHRSWEPTNASHKWQRTVDQFDNTRPLNRTRKNCIVTPSCLHVILAGTWKCGSSRRIFTFTALYAFVVQKNIFQ